MTARHFAGDIPSEWLEGDGQSSLSTHTARHLSASADIAENLAVPDHELTGPPANTEADEAAHALIEQIFLELDAEMRLAREAVSEPDPEPEPRPEQNLEDVLLEDKGLGSAAPAESAPDQSSEPDPVPMVPDLPVLDDRDRVPALNDRTPRAPRISQDFWSQAASEEVEDQSPKSEDGQDQGSDLEATAVLPRLVTQATRNLSAREDQIVAWEDGAVGGRIPVEEPPDIPQAMVSTVSQAAGSEAEERRKAIEEARRAQMERQARELEEVRRQLAEERLAEEERQRQQRLDVSYDLRDRTTSTHAVRVGARRQRFGFFASIGEAVARLLRLDER